MSDQETDIPLGGTPSSTALIKADTATASTAADSARAAAVATSINNGRNAGIPKKGSGQQRFRQLIPERGSWRLPHRPAMPFHERTALVRGRNLDDTALDSSTSVPAMATDMTLGSGGSVGGTRIVGPQAPNPTSPCLLSLECQKRKFNPIFHVWATPDGGFKCSVSVNGVIVYDNRSYDSIMDAKESVAKQALDVVRKLPCPMPKVAQEVPEQLESVATNGHRGFARARSEYRRIKSEDRDVRRITAATKPGRRHNGGRHPDQPSLSYLPDYYNGPAFAGRQNADHDRALGSSFEDGYRTVMENVLALVGDEKGPSQRILDDPVASQAYLQGFALGGRAAKNAKPLPRNRRQDGGRTGFGRGFISRERSPVPSPTKVLRERSPLRRSSD
ncbi:hypothetical protein Hte_009459 [Hypoxylon texense]